MMKSLLPMNICMQRPFLPINICMQRPVLSMQRKNHSPPYNISGADDDEYIDIEVNSFSPERRSFEFQMCSAFTDKEELTAFPADDLFYKGKLLPLLPPRMQTLQGDHNSITEEDDQFIVMEFASSTSSPSKNGTSTPVEPCRLSFALNPDDHFERSTCLSTSINRHPEKRYSWFSILGLIKKPLMGNRQKDSCRACLRSFFRKSACIDVSSAMAPDYNPAGTDKLVSNGECFRLKSKKIEQKKSLFGHTGMWRHKVSNHRSSLSFSSSSSTSTSAEYKRRRSLTKCLAPSSSGASSSSFSSSLSSISFSSSDFHELNFHNRSCSFTSDIDGLIEAAIVHCKKSQEVSKAGHFALSSTPKTAVQVRM